MIKIGGTEISDVMLGSTQVEKVYLGSSLVWEKGSPGPVLPYDAEVEYLQTNGNQYVSPGVYGNLNYYAEVEFCPSDGNTVVFGSRSSATSRNFSVLCGADAIYADFGNYNNTRCTLNTTISDGHWYKVTMDKNKRRIEDLDNGAFAEQSTAYSTSFTTPYQLRIGGKGNNFPNSYTAFVGKIRSVKFYESGTLVRDFIPVRVGTTGYLWDKVTEELYGNSGSGSFTLGPDVS